MKLFSKKVLQLTRKIPKGKVTTYSEIARVLGKPRASRAVGNILNRNEHPDTIPCYRIVRADGMVGGYGGGVGEKIRRLERDGIALKGKKVDLKKYFHSFARKS